MALDGSVADPHVGGHSAELAAALGAAGAVCGVVIAAFLVRGARDWRVVHVAIVVANAGRPPPRRRRAGSPLAASDGRDGCGDSVVLPDACAQLRNLVLRWLYEGSVGCSGAP